MDRRAVTCRQGARQYCYIYVYIYICVCIYIYIYICVCLCVSACIYHISVCVYVVCFQSYTQCFVTRQENVARDRRAVTCGQGARKYNYNIYLCLYIEVSVSMPQFAFLISKFSTRADVNRFIAKWRIIEIIIIVLAACFEPFSRLQL